MEEFLHFLQGRMETPTNFGWFHLMWLGIVLTSCILIYIFRKRITPKKLNIILLVVGIALILFEIYKQIVFSFNYNGGNGNSYWDYQWYSFPFQFCSTPMFVMPLLIFFRKGKVRDCLLCYLATYSMFGGLTVLAYTGQVFTFMIGINLHTMFWHASLFVMGFLVLATKSVKFEMKSVLKATAVFGVMLVLAFVMNIIWHFCGNGETFNMFYISPYYLCTLPLLSIIAPVVPYVVFLFIYIFGFMLIATIFIAVAMGLDKLDEYLHDLKLSEEDKLIKKILQIIRSNL